MSSFTIKLNVNFEGLIAKLHHQSYHQTKIKHYSKMTLRDEWHEVSSVSRIFILLHTASTSFVSFLSFYSYAKRLLKQSYLCDF